MTDVLPISMLDDTLYIAYLTTFPPRQCGIATFTEDLIDAIDEIFLPSINSRVIAMNNPEMPRYEYPQKVFLQINQDNQQEYIDVARQINEIPHIHLVNVQHEFGIYGGDMGSYLISFLETLEKPSVISCHTVLPDPDKELMQLVRSLADNASALIAMTGFSKKILAREYNVPENKIYVVPHGIHSRPFVPGHWAKKTLGYSDKVVLSTFGMLSRGKGLEYVIDALPDVIKEFPDLVYLIVGATHPLVVEWEGESYRDSLQKKIFELGLYDHVKLYNKYYPLDELLHFLKATDIYISTSLNPDQAVSGTLSYALGMGRAVISTAFAQAKESITDDVGIIVDIRDSKAYTEAILQLLKDENQRNQFGKNAYFRTRNMTWENVALHYSLVFSRYSPELAEISRKKSLPQIKIDHIVRLTDDHGIIQFARMTRPDISSGYTLDDNARALAAISLYCRKLGKAINQRGKTTLRRKLNKLIDTYLRFIASARNKEGQFINYMNGDMTFNNDMNSQINPEDAEARTIYALAVTSTTSTLSRPVRNKASALLDERMNMSISFKSPRAIATYIKMLHTMLVKKKVEDASLRKALVKQCNRLVRLYENTATRSWQWFEKYLTYNNGVLPESLLLGYEITRNNKYLKIGKNTLEFLIKKSFIDGLLVPIGQEGWFTKGGKRYHYDQQPEEVKSIICCLKACYEITGDKRYYDMMMQAFYWFLGDNSLNQVVYDRMTGGCYDGVGRTEINLNQGAESTISYLIARLAIE